MELYGGTIDNQLTGLSLVERYKSLNHLIEKSDPQVLSLENLQKWSNKSQADQIYIAKLADHSKNARVLCDILKSENQMVVSIALNATWLFKGISDENIVNPDYFVKEIFPNATYHNICRIVSLFGAHLENEGFAEDLYTKILPIYGKDLTIKLLARCSLQFIRTHIMVDNFEVPCLPLTYVYKRDPKLVIEYLEKYLRRDGVQKMPMNYRSKQDYDKLWIVIAQQYPEDFLRMFLKYRDCIRVQLGSRTTLGILKIHLDAVMEKPSEYLHLLHLPTLFSKLKGENFEKFVLTFMPSKEKEFAYFDISKHLTHLKPAYRVQFLIRIYAMKYGTSVLLRSDFADWDLAEHLPARDRNDWALAKIENIQSSDWLKEDYYLKYVSPDKAIPRLMTLSKTASDLEKRISLLEKMLDCCKINGDTIYLLKVLRYVAQRHRNDQHTLRYRFLNHLEEVFKLHELSAEHWEIINEMIEFMCVSKEIKNNGHEYFLQSFLEQSIRFRLNNNQEIDSLIDKLMAYNTNNVNLLVGVPEHEFVVLDAFFAKYKAIIESNINDDKVKGMIETLLHSYEKRSDAQNHSVTECAWLIAVIRQLLDGNKGDLRDLHTILYHLQRDVKSRVMFANEIFECNNSDEVSENYLRHDASVLMRNLTSLYDRCLQTYSLKGYARLFHLIRAYMNKPLVELIVKGVREHCADKEDKEAVEAVVLSLILNIEESEKFIEKLFPSETKIDLTLHKSEYVNGEFIAGSFKYINPPVSYSTLAHFAKDDYLKFTVPSLLSLAFQKSLADTLDFVKELTEKPVSVKKHGIRLAYFLFPREELLPFYRGLWDSEKNHTIREVLFQRTFRLLQTEDDRVRYAEIWQTLKHFMQSFSELDINLLCYLQKVESILPELISEYCETCWKTLKMLKLQKVVVNDEINALTSNFISCAQHLSEDFCEFIVSEYMDSIDDESGTSDNLLSFLVYYLVNSKTSELQSKHLKNTCELFKTFITQKYNKKVDDEFKYRSTVSNFVLKCCNESLNSELAVDPLGLLKTISELLSSTLPFGAVFSLHFVLNLCIRYRELLGKPVADILGKDSPLAEKLIRDFGVKVGLYLVDVRQEFGPEICHLFVGSFKIFYDFLLDYEKKERLSMHFIEGLLDGGTESCYVMAIDLLPSGVDSDSANFVRYQKIMQQIKTQGNVTIKMILGEKFSFYSDDLFNAK